MSKEENNKAIVGRWFTYFWGKTCNLGIVDELAAPNMLLQYSLHAPRKGHADIKAFMTNFREAFPDLNFWGAADLIAEGDLCGRPLGRRRHALWSSTQRFSHGIIAGSDRTEDAIHRNDRAESKRRQDCRRDRSRRWCYRPSAAWHHRSKLNGRIVDVINAFIDSESRNWAFTFAQFPQFLVVWFSKPLLGTDEAACHRRSAL